MAKADTVIQKDENGFDINYGPLVLVEIAGVTVTLEEWRAEQLGLTFTVGEIGDFVKGIRLDIRFGNGSIGVYVFRKEDLKTVGMALSLIKDGYRVAVHSHARNLMVWENGVVVSEQLPLEHFYIELTPEQIELTTF